MKSISLSMLVSIATLCFSTHALANDIPDCQKTAAPNSTCLMKVKDLHPTQFSVGSVAVECKKKKIEKKYKKGKLAEYLTKESKQVPAIIGPDGHFYITDHHHLSTAVYRAKQDDWRGEDQKLHIKILKNFYGTDTSMEKFWSTMTTQSNVWPYDEKGKKVAKYGDKLSTMNMDDLKDNPYRTLSRWTRESCGYIKKGKEQCLALKATKEPPTDPYFMEFYWAQFLRDQLKKDNADLDSPQELMDSYPKAIQVTLSKKKTNEFFENKSLDAVKYGQNQEGTYLYLNFSNDACEEWYLKKN